MKKLVVFIGVLLISAGGIAQTYWSPDKPVHVRGYYRADGTYVHPYYRSYPHYRNFGMSPVQPTTINDSFQQAQAIRNQYLRNKILEERLRRLENK